MLNEGTIGSEERFRRQLDKLLAFLYDWIAEMRSDKKNNELRFQQTERRIERLEDIAKGTLDLQKGLMDRQTSFEEFTKDNIEAIRDETKVIVQLLRNQDTKIEDLSRRQK